MKVSSQSKFYDAISISDVALDMDELIKEAHANNGESGAVVTFTGAVRVSDEEQGLTGMTLEHYPGMTESQLASILEEAEERWRLTRMLVSHRVGYLAPGDPIVFVATAGLHRKEAFEAAEFIMDYLKKKATFWKKEHYGDRTQWVEAKESDEQAAARWER
ncbi:molybdenum cofactor biosynthesis protein MoaE [Aliikangiella sp. G2MR2-5]|uniref:molybdenum cofactor biosynthesis protein MoaE n=1 Tax=Aliikangiella sp. G2MR2-5 TaxID=2788943 RepID=UPI001FEF5960|nr:molybdenum cofactor biosynthesis protein MoaE [Aliikangiella sp. G2MR2-5]